MATLKELYTTLKSLRDMNLPIDDKLTKAADELEEKIIKEEILPSLSQNIEPLLNEIQRDLVLVVEYHPNEPISVALSRKVKISEIGDAKPLTPQTGRISVPISGPKPEPANEAHEPTKHVENKTKGLKVTFRDGTVVCESNAIKTFEMVISRIGLEKVAKIGIQHAGYDLVGKIQRPTKEGRIWQHKMGDYFIYVNMSNQTKEEDLRTISNYYGLGLKIETR